MTHRSLTNRPRRAVLSSEGRSCARSSPTCSSSWTGGSTTPIHGTTMGAPQLAQMLRQRLQRVATCLLHHGVLRCCNLCCNMACYDATDATTCCRSIAYDDVLFATGTTTTRRSLRTTLHTTRRSWPSPPHSASTIQLCRVPRTLSSLRSQVLPPTSASSPSSSLHRVPGAPLLCCSLRVGADLRAPLR